MDSTSQAVIVIRPPSKAWLGGSERSESFIVWIDGRDVGKVKGRFPGEFALEPGQHEVAVSLHRVRSLPFQVAIACGSRTELVIDYRLKFLRFLLFMFVVWAIIEGLRATLGIENRWARAVLVLAVVGTLLVGALVAAMGVTSVERALWSAEALGKLTVKLAGPGSPKSVDAH